MVRPRRCRLISMSPEVRYFKPRGVPLRRLSEVILSVDELEALRLKHLEGLEQIDCAKKMKISQSTFQRILSAAQQKISRALIKGYAIKIEGGVVRYR